MTGTLARRDRSARAQQANRWRRRTKGGKRRMSPAQRRKSQRCESVTVGAGFPRKTRQPPAPGLPKLASKRTHPPVRPAAGDPMSAEDTEPPVVLFVDDEPSILSSLRRLFR